LIAVDTNVLVYAHRSEFPQHRAALGALRRLSEGPAAWAIPVFVLGEFIRVATHPRVLSPPSTTSDAIAVLDELLSSPSVRILLPQDRYWELLREAIRESAARGNIVFDAQIVALCREHGVVEILTEDRDFRAFRGIAIKSL